VKPQTATCYQSENNLVGLTVNAISIDDGVNYNITGKVITIGAGGLTAAPSAKGCSPPNLCGPPQLRTPITLGASQTWSITGGSKNQQLGLDESVTGAAESLGINFASNTFLGINAGASVEVGAVTANGHGTVALAGTSLDGGDGNAVGLTSGAGLFAAFGGSKVGPLTSSEGQMQVGEGLAPDGTLAVNGGVTLDSKSSLLMFIDHSGTTPGTDYSQLSATGAMNLAGAHLTLADGTESVGGKSQCAVLKPGDVDTLLTTTSSLAGTFAGVPDGTTVPLSFCPGVFGGKLPTVKVNYTAKTVTATVLTPGGGPTVSKVSPSAGLIEGKTSVTITGANFTGATAVNFGTKPAASFTVNSATSITAVSPAEPAGTVDVTVTTPEGTSATSSADHFTYVPPGPAPTVTKVSPATGPVAGGTSVTITGTNFSGVTAVKFGATAASSFIVNSATSVTTIAPAEPVGKVDVTVTTPNGTSALSSKDHFSFTPTVTGVGPNAGSTAGGTKVTITGTGFALGSIATSFLFGTTKGTSVNCTTTTECTVISPAHSAGKVDVKATVNKVASPKNSPADQFTYS
jgi:hypothetical protein